MLIAALFTIAKMCKQPKCPPTDERTSNIYSGILVIKKSEILAFGAT